MHKHSVHKYFFTGKNGHKSECVSSKLGHLVHMSTANCEKWRQQYITQQIKQRNFTTFEN